MYFQSIIKVLYFYFFTFEVLFTYYFLNYYKTQSAVIDLNHSLVHKVNSASSTASNKNKDSNYLNTRTIFGSLYILENVLAVQNFYSSFFGKHLHLYLNSDCVIPATSDHTSVSNKGFKNTQNRNGHNTNTYKHNTISICVELNFKMTHVGASCPVRETTNQQEKDLRCD